MKKKFVACLLAGMMLLGAAALADGGGVRAGGRSLL